jgi:hypothetical protein
MSWCGRVQANEDVTARIEKLSIELKEAKDHDSFVMFLRLPTWRRGNRQLHIFVCFLKYFHLLANYKVIVFCKDTNTVFATSDPEKWN